MGTVKYLQSLQHLKSFNYLPTECKQMRLVCDGGTPSLVLSSLPKVI
ncbi:MAG: hypothetical protein RMY27_07155 [Nostoc sp. DedQUE09]|nr:hypothetical protein [Nostoc sp. DedQUE09]